MHYVTVTGHSDGVHKKQRHTPGHVSGRLSSFCCLLTRQTNLHKNNFDTHQSVTGLARVGTRLYDSPARAELYGYATNNVAYCRPSSWAAFHAQLTGERDRPLYMLQRNFGFKTKLNAVWPSDFSPSYHIWAAELGTTRVFTHACIWQVEHASSPPSPTMGSMPGTTSSYHDVIIWGPPFCISCSR